MSTTDGPLRRQGRWTVAGVVFALTWSIALILTGFVSVHGFLSGRTRALETAGQLMDRSVEITRLKLERHFDPIEVVVRYSPLWPELARGIEEGSQPLRARFMRILGDMPQLSSIFVGFANGDYYLLGLTRHRPQARLAEMGAPQQSVFIEERILRAGRTQAILVDSFLDAQGNPLHSIRTLGEDFDPRQRPWYQAALAGEEVVRTPVYRFVGSGNFGLSLARRHEGGVVGVDITLQELDGFLRQLPEAEMGLIAIVTADDQVIAGAGGAGRSRAGGFIPGSPGFEEAVDDLTELDPGRLSSTAAFDLDGRPWIGRSAAVAIGSNGAERLYVAMPVGVVVAPIIDGLRMAMVVAILIVLASAPLVWLISKWLSVPIARLAMEADEIRRFDLARGPGYPSGITEIQHLESAMARMRSNLRVFALYVPKALVRQLVSQEEMPVLGGTRREITVLFLDMENFTAMSERLEPEAVMERMSAYFEAVTGVLIRHDATIDKFIGDAVMAFWNAPGDTPDHVALACAAALEIIQAVTPLTAQWSLEGGAPLRTRIGIHTGTAIVGNVGSSDRMNYTALGATVNLAARLESLNREAHTAIMVSAAVATALDRRFTFRPAGELSLKGFSKPVSCFELVGAGQPIAEVPEAEPSRSVRE